MSGRTVSSYVRLKGWWAITNDVQSITINTNFQGGAVHFALNKLKKCFPFNSYYVKEIVFSLYYKNTKPL